jgi:hypothetical protein
MVVNMVCCYSAWPQHKIITFLHMAVTNTALGPKATLAKEGVAIVQVHFKCPSHHENIQDELLHGQLLFVFFLSQDTLTDGSTCIKHFFNNQSKLLK